MSFLLSPVYLTHLPHLALPLAASMGEIYLLQEVKTKERIIKTRTILDFITGLFGLTFTDFASMGMKNDRTFYIEKSMPTFKTPCSFSRYAQIYIQDRIYTNNKCLYI